MKVKQTAWKLLFTVVLASMMAFGGMQAQSTRHRIGATCKDGQRATKNRIMNLLSLAGSFVISRCLLRHCFECASLFDASYHADYFDSCQTEPSYF